MNRQVDVAIIGAGSAGLSALRQVKRASDSYVLIDQGPLGTTCARVGCMPSKAMIELSYDVARFQRLKTGKFIGSDMVQVDIPRVLEHVRELRDRFTHGMIDATRRLAGEALLEGQAEFISPGRLRVNGFEVEAKRIIVAVGATPVVPEIWQKFGDRILTSETIFEQTDLPSRIAVIGLGAIGLELGQAISRLGIEVTGFDLGETIGGLSDPDINAVMIRCVGKEFPIHLGHQAEVHAAGDALTVEAGNARVEVDKILVAAGTRPNLDGLGLERLNLPLDAQGVPQCDPQTMQAGHRPVFLAGDVNGYRPILHEALDEGFMAGRNAIADSTASYQHRVALRVVFSDPQITVVGRARSQLRDRDIIVGTIDFKNQARAIVAGRGYGILNIYVDPQSGCLLGSEMAGPDAEHLGHLLALAIQQNMSILEMLRMPFYHPTIEEGLRSALRHAAEQLPDSIRRDEGTQCEICPEPPLR